MASETFLATFGLIGLRLIELHGINPQRFIEQVGIDSALILETKTRLPSRFVDIGFEKASSLIPDPAFALRAAECWHPSNLGTLGYAWLSSSTLRTGLKRLVRYSRTLGTKATCRLVDERDGLRFTFDHGRGNTPVGCAIVDFALSLILGMCRTNFGAALHPVTVNLRRPKPADPKPYRDFFGCSIRFGADEDSFTLALSAVDKPLPTSNHELASTFDVILGDQLAELSASDLQTRCHAYLLKELTSGEPAEDALAWSMGMSRRTLQRKLGEHGLTYKALLKKTRYDLALRYLDDPARTITDITFLLGFSEQSAFTRAFKRWNGKAPTAYRAQQAALV